jgi:AcrR family transcriptional regulator
MARSGHAGAAGNDADFVFGESFGARVIDVAIRRDYIWSFNRSAGRINGWDKHFGDAVTNEMSYDGGNNYDDRDSQRFAMSFHCLPLLIGFLYIHHLLAGTGTPFPDVSAWPSIHNCTEKDYDRLACPARPKFDMPQRPSTPRLTREAWLARALDALAKQGERVLTVDALVRLLGVSRGSFYWHFKDRADFFRQLVHYWSANYTENVPKYLATVHSSASDKLLALMDLVFRGRLARYDIAMRSWAAHDPTAARLVKQVDQFRMDYVRSQFAELGFKEEELEVRARAFIVYLSMESGLFAAQSKQTQSKQLKALHAFFTRP